MNTINYSNIEKTIAFYTDYGFKNIEVPWRVSYNILEETAPENSFNYMISGTDKGLLASGEQGFLYLVNKGFLPPGSYITTTPCFRNDSHDYTHSKQFLKTELFHYGTSELDIFMNVILKKAKENFSKLSGKKEDEFLNLETTVHKALRNEDIFFGNYELGSYGIRETSICTYFYGTAIAEPRFSKVVK